MALLHDSTTLKCSMHSRSCVDSDLADGATNLHAGRLIHEKRKYLCRKYIQSCDYMVNLRKFLC